MIIVTIKRELIAITTSIVMTQVLCQAVVRKTVCPADMPPVPCLCLRMRTVAGGGENILYFICIFLSNKVILHILRFREMWVGVTFRMIAIDRPLRMRFHPIPVYENQRVNRSCCARYEQLVPQPAAFFYKSIPQPFFCYLRRRQGVVPGVKGY